MCGSESCALFAGKYEGLLSAGALKELAGLVTVYCRRNFGETLDGLCGFREQVDNVCSASAPHRLYSPSFVFPMLRLQKSAFSSLERQLVPLVHPLQSCILRVRVIISL